MTFSQPLSLSEAVKALLARDLMPTDLDTEGLRALDAALRASSFFSAQTTNEYLLQLYKDRIEGILHPVPAAGEATTQFSPAYIRRDLKDFLASIGYQPEPGQRGTLQDLSADPRINLVIKTNVDLAQGQGWWMQGQNGAILDEFPAQELFRAEERAKKRAWLERWRQAGAQTGDAIGTGWTITPEERMIALKDHAVWNWIGSSELFDDALDVIWPPFAFNSGMWVRDVDRAGAEAAGLMQPGDAAPQIISITDALKRFTSKVSKLAA
jgi:hypothetical protein